ncbi:MAG TPA: Rieske 2Fe-2S domain-containing protein [Mycobacteriales bacterium]|nr:Rieske 2Fe-2S domain-containing protein [Mycobacteriales bacterium]
MSDLSPQGPEPRRQIGRRPDGLASPPIDEPGSDVAVITEEVTELDTGHDEVDPRVDRAAEVAVSGLFILAMVAVVAFVVFYVTISIHTNIGKNSNLALGGSLAVALVALGVGQIIWAKVLLPHKKAVQQRHAFNSDPQDFDRAADTLMQGVDDLGLGKRTMLRRTLIGALALLPVPVVILLRDLGPLPGGSLLPTGQITGWKAGVRLVDLDTKVPVKLGDLEIGGIQTVMPEGFDSAENYALAPTMLIRFGPGEILVPKEENWGVADHVAYSKICTHAGCPISLYEQQTHYLLCPCHQSTFDMARNAKVIFGPAARPLPQLEIGVDSEGYFIAKGPYSQPVGPSFWERR